MVVGYVSSIVFLPRRIIHVTNLRDREVSHTGVEPSLVSLTNAQRMVLICEPPEPQLYQQSSRSNQCRQLMLMSYREREGTTRTQSESDEDMRRHADGQRDGYTIAAEDGGTVGTQRISLLRHRSDVVPDRFC